MTTLSYLTTAPLWKQFEYAGCKACDISYNESYEYVEPPEDLIYRLIPLRFTIWIHTAARGGRYDFTEVGNENNHLSFKTTLKDGLICPQVIGQTTRKRWCNYFNLNESSSDQQIKHYILQNVNNMLFEYFNHTFDCPIVYYNKSI